MFDLNDGEKLILEIRRHWFVILFPALASFVLLLFPFFALALFFATAPYLGINTQHGIDWATLSLLGAFLYILFVLMVVVFFSVQWTEYYLDVWYVTDQRLVDIDQKSIFTRSTKSLRFERVQDITVEVKGVIATLLKFGDIHVQTAGASREIIIRHARRPYKARKVILDIHDVVTRKITRHPGHGMPVARSSHQQ